MDLASVTLKSHPCLHEGTSGSQMPNWNLQRRSNVTKMLVVAPPILPPPFLLKDLKFEKSSNGSNGSLPTNDLHMTKKNWRRRDVFLDLSWKLFSNSQNTTNNQPLDVFVMPESLPLLTQKKELETFSMWIHWFKISNHVLHLDHFCLYFAVGYFMQGPQGLNQQFIDRNSAKKKGKQQVPKKRKVSNTWWLCNLWCDI